MPQDTTEVTIEELPTTSAIGSQDGANANDTPRDNRAEPAEEVVIPPEEEEDYVPHISDEFPDGKNDGAGEGEEEDYVPHII